MAANAARVAAAESSYQLPSVNDSLWVDDDRGLAAPGRTADVRRAADVRGRAASVGSTQLEGLQGKNVVHSSWLLEVAIFGSREVRDDPCPARGSTPIDPDGCRQLELLVRTWGLRCRRSGSLAPVVTSRRSSIDSGSNDGNWFQYPRPSHSAGSVPTWVGARGFEWPRAPEAVAVGERASEKSPCG